MSVLVFVVSEAGLGQPLSVVLPEPVAARTVKRWALVVAKGAWQAVMPERDEAESLILAQNERWRRA